MMKLSYVIIIACLVFSFIGCNEDPDICLESRPMPIVYSIFSQKDSVNYVVLTKLFSGDNGGSLTNAKIWDSIYFKNARIKTVLWRHPLESPTDFQRDTILLAEETATGKEPGIFAYPAYKQFVLRKNLADYFGYSLLVEIPGYVLAPLYESFVYTPELNLSSYQLTIRPDLAMFIRWGRVNSSAMDLRIDFMIATHRDSQVFIDTITYSKYGMVQSDNPLPEQTSFSYKQFLGLLNSKFKNNNIDYRQITDVKVTLTAVRGLGATQLTNDYLNFVMPDNLKYNPNSLVLSIMASKASTCKAGLKIDPSDMEIMNDIPEFAKFKFIKW